MATLVGSARMLMRGKYRKPIVHRLLSIPSLEFSKDFTAVIQIET
jgi:hypothetical protein